MTVTKHFEPKLPLACVASDLNTRKCYVSSVKYFRLALE